MRETVEGLDPLAIDDHLARTAHTFADRSSVVRALATALRSPVRYAQLVKSVRRLPRLNIDLSAGCRTAAEQLLSPARRRAGPLPTGRIAQSVLLIPSDGYTRGRHMQALRTNAARARRDGTAVALANSDEAVEAIHCVLDDKQFSARARARMLTTARSPHTAVWVARSECGEPVGFAILTLARPWARLEHSVAHTDGTTRWLLHLAIVEDLQRLRFTHLTVASAFVEPAGVRHFQSLTGFKVYNLRIGTNRASEPCTWRPDTSADPGTGAYLLSSIPMQADVHADDGLPDPAA